MRLLKAHTILVILLKCRDPLIPLILLQVRIFTLNPDGVIMVKFQTDDAANQCIKVMDGRWFGGRQVEAHLWDGIKNYHVKPKEESAEEQQARLENFGQQLDAQALGPTTTLEHETAHAT